MTIQTARERLPLCSAELDAAQQRLTLQRSIRTEIQTQIAALQTTRKDRLQWGTLTDLQDSLRQLDRGITDKDGVTFPAHNQLLNQPGLVATERQVANLTAEQRALRVFLERWGDGADSVRHPYRYVGRPGKSVFNGKDLQPGDVVQLTAVQADSWADRFEAVGESKSSVVPTRGDQAAAPSAGSATWGRSATAS